MPTFLSITGGILLANGVAAVLGGVLHRRRRRLRCRVLHRRPYPPKTSSALSFDGRDLSRAVIDWEPSRGNAYRYSYGAWGLVTVGSLFHFPLMLVTGGLLTSYWFVPSFRESIIRMRDRRRLTLGGVMGLSTLAFLSMRMNLLAASSFNLYQVGRHVSKNVRRHSRRFLAEVFAGEKAEAWILCDGVEIAVPFRDLGDDDLIVVKEGGVVPVDGLIVEGRGELNQHLLSADIGPVTRSAGQTVLASSYLESGRLTLRKVFLEADQ